MKMLCRAIIFMAVMLLVTTHDLVAQTGKVQVDLTFNPDLKNDVNDLRIRIDISKGYWKDANYFNKSFYLDDGARGVIIDSLQAGIYDVTIAGKMNMRNGKWIENYNFKNVSISSIEISDNKTAKVKSMFPEDCVYLKDFHNKVCPKCHSSDNVIRVEFGDIVADPTDNAPESYHANRESTGCDPVWYCKKDKLEF
jgi:hypothetical protein